MAIVLPAEYSMKILGDIQDDVSSNPYMNRAKQNKPWFILA